MLFSDLIIVGKLRAEHIVDFRIPLETIMHFEPEMFEDVKLIDDELIKINETWCTVVHANKKLAECHSDIHKQKDEKYTYLAERMELFRQKRITIFDLHVQFKMILDNLPRKDKMTARYAKNCLEKVRSIPLYHPVFSGQVVQYHFKLFM